MPSERTSNFWTEAYKVFTVIGQDMKQQVLLVRIHYFKTGFNIMC